MKKCCLFLVLCLPVAAFAQSNYKPGYVVSLNGDTIKGAVDYKEWEKNPKQIMLKSNAGTMQYTAQNAKAFAVTGLEYYETHTVSVSTDVVDINRFAARSDSDFVKDTVFLKVLATGKHLKLYSYTDALKPRYYLAETGTGAPPEELAYHLSFRSDNTSDILFVRRYRTQLQFEAEKFQVANLDNLIGRAAYGPDDLITLVSKINGEAYQQMVSQSQFGTRWFAGAGGSYSDLVFRGNIVTQDSYSVFPKISLGIDFLPNRVTQQLSLRIEAVFTGDQHTFKDSYHQTSLVFHQYTVALAPQVYYNFYNGENVKVFAGGGLLLNFSTYPNSYSVVTEGINPMPVEIHNYPDYHTLWESFILKAGVIVNKHIEIYGAYVPVTTLTNNYENLIGTITSYQAGVNFLFGAK